MTTNPRDNHQGDFTIATIFDDSVYLSEALNLPVHQNEEDADAELALLARESGIEDPYQYLPPRDVSRALSTVTLDSDHRSSMSIHSQETQSTSLTSAPSRTSRDHVYSSDRSAGPRLQPQPAQASPPADAEQATTGTTPPLSQSDFSTSDPSIAQSIASKTSSISAASPASPAPRRRRASGIFGMFRKESRTCTSQSHLSQYSRGRGTKLECGHALFHYAIRVHIQEALQRGGQSLPSCCGANLPREVLEEVLTREETDVLLDSASATKDTTPSRDSGYCEKVVSSTDFAPAPELPRSLATANSRPSTMTRRRHEAISIDSALAHEAFKTFRIQQKEQFDRVSAFESYQRKALSAHYEMTLKRLVAQHEVDKSEKKDQHARELEHVEEMQIVAEHDLRKAHDLETQNVATALKHMEAYCLGNRPLHPDRQHVVTEDDFIKLDSQRTTQKNLPKKHENAINVLRARQERDIKIKLQKHKTELHLMNQDHDRKQATEEAELKREMEKLDAVINERRKRLLQRWDLKFEMWRRDWEEQHGSLITGRLEHADWPSLNLKSTTTIPTTSSLAPYLQASA